MSHTPTISTSTSVPQLQNKILRQTYTLLGFTLLFSAAMAWIAILMRVAPVNIWLFLIGAYGLLFLTHVLKNSAWGLLSVLAFTGFMGYAIGPIVGYYLQSPSGAQTVALALTLTATIFFGLSAYAVLSGKDLSFLGRFIFCGALILIGLMVAGIFIQVAAFHLMLSALFAFFAAAVILYQTNVIVRGGETNYIIATLTLYVSIYNLFMSLLHLLSAFSGRE